MKRIFVVIVSAQYLYVKVIDDETIAHLGDKNNVFNYKVTNYTITYFEN